MGSESRSAGLLPLGTNSTLQQICFILASFLSPSGGGRAGGPGGIHPKWASISFLSLWALCQAELQAVTLQTVINHKLWAVLKCLPRNLLVHRKSEMLLIGFQQLSPFLAQIYLIWHSDNTVDYSPEHSLDPSCVSLDCKYKQTEVAGS